MEQKKIIYLILILLSLILSFKLEAQTSAKAWYVDKNAKGTGTGKTIENAWTSFANIGWSSMADGDTLYISGGSDSTVYNETLTIGKGNLSIIRMTVAGHYGKVIIDGQGIRDYGILNQSSYNNITIDGKDKTKFIIRKFLYQGIRFKDNSYQTARNFTIELNEQSAFSGVFLYSMEYKLPPAFTGHYLIENFSILQNSGSYSGGGNSDGIQIGGVKDVTIRNGYIRLWNSDNYPHQDGIQAYHSKNLLIEGNQIYHLNNGATDHRQGIYITDSGGDIKIRNNYISLEENSPGSAIAIEIYDNTWWTTYLEPDSFIVTNNTVNCVYDAPNAIRLVQSLSPTSFSANTILKNNIFIEGNIALDKKYFTTASNCDYNIYYDKDASTTIYDQTTNSSGTSRSWSTWQGYGFDANSKILNPQLVGYVPAYTVNILGNDLSNLGYSTDIEGKMRPTGGWSIGAYQYNTGTVSTDNTPPTLVSASVINPTSIVLNFSEPLELTSAQAKSNYSINNGININSAVLSSDGKKVTLNTTTNSPDQTYTVVVSNVKDLAGNVVASSGNSVSYSYTQTSTGDLKANVKVFLEGPLDSNVMLTELSGNEFLPSTQPYNTAPWFYGGKEVLGSGVSSATDWVLVELHSAQDPSQIVAKRACLLRNDGRIIEPNGTLGVTFNNLFYGSYYIAVRHRNHLAVMSSSPVSFSPNNDLYDFTTSVIQAYGQNAMMQIAPGVYAMYAGDGNGDGIIDDKDRDDLWNSQNGNMGYLNGDFNLDSGVTVKDINDFWNINHDKKTQVP